MNGTVPYLLGLCLTAGCAVDHLVHSQPAFILLLTALTLAPFACMTRRFIMEKKPNIQVIQPTVASPTAQTFIVDGTWFPYAYMAAGHIEENYRWPYESAVDALNQAAQATHPVAA